MKYLSLFILLLLSFRILAQPNDVEIIKDSVCCRVIEYNKKVGRYDLMDVVCYQYPGTKGDDTIVSSLLKTYSKLAEVPSSTLWVTLGIQPHSYNKENKQVEKAVYLQLRDQLIANGLKKRKIWHRLLVYTDMNGHLDHCSDYEIYISIYNKHY